MLMTLSVFSTMKMRLFYFSIFLIHNISISNLPWKKKQTGFYLFLISVLILTIHLVLKLSVYRKKTFTGLLTNFFSFISFSYKVGLIRTLVDRAYKINNSLLSFNNDVKKLTHILKGINFLNI